MWDNAITTLKGHRAPPSDYSLFGDAHINELVEKKGKAIMEILKKAA